MSLRILADDELGYAVLDFAKRIEDGPVVIAVRSLLRKGAYLGPDGRWQDEPHYFPAERAGPAATTTRLRVGPEIVNHLAELEAVELSTRDGRLTGTAKWENAIPQIGPPAGDHRIYRPPPRSDPANNATPAPVETPAPVDQNATNGDEGSETVITPVDPIPGPLPSPRRRLWPVIVSAIALALLGSMAVILLLPGQRCRLLGLCPAPAEDRGMEEALSCARVKLPASPCEVEACFARRLAAQPADRERPDVRDLLNRGGAECVAQRDDAAASAARVCVDQSEAAGQVCEIRSSCVASYLAAFPNGRAAAELAERGRQAASACEGDEAAARSALTCADQKRDANQSCDIEAKCLNPYGRTFPGGRFAGEIEGRRRVAVAACAEENAGDRARACITDRRGRGASCDVQQACVAPYLRAFPNGRVRAGLEQQGREAAAVCGEERDFASAEACATRTDPCRVQEICFPGYASAPAGTARDRMRRIVEDAAGRCRPTQPPATVPSPIRDGTHGARATGCGPTQNGLSVFVSGSRLSWTHEYRGREYRWDATIDASGAILGAVTAFSGTRAVGRYGDQDRYIDLTYPQCGPVRMEILNYRGP